LRRGAWRGAHRATFQRRDVTVDIGYKTAELSVLRAAMHVGSSGIAAVDAAERGVPVVERV